MCTSTDGQNAQATMKRIRKTQWIQKELTRNRAAQWATTRTGKNPTGKIIKICRELNRLPADGWQSRTT